MIYDSKLDAELKQTVDDHPHNFIKILNSRGLKPTSIDRQYLRDYVFKCTSQLTNDKKYNYKLSTLLYWALNHISSWDDERVKCKVCGNPLHGIDIKHIAFGYNRQTCSKECERKLASKSTIENLKLKYGVINAFQLQSIKAKLNAKKDLMQIHRNETKRKNNTFKTSKKEDEAYRFLCQRFNEKDIIRQYHSDAYPFNCDFYIKSLDLYIECNFSWTHGKHFFDESNEEDLKTLAIWRSKGTRYYLNAIETWTVRDVKKRKAAEENNLNYIVFWSLDEMEKLHDIHKR